MDDSVTASEFHLTIDEDGTRALDALASATQLPKLRLKDALNKGAVWLRGRGGEQRLRRATKSLRRGDQIALYYDEALLKLEPPQPQLIADEIAYSVWHKPAGLLAQGTRYGDHCALLRWCEKHFTPARDCFLVHRLDREAEGLMLIAHTRKAADAFSKLWQQRDITKQYRVIAHGNIGAIGEQRVIELPLDDKPSRTEFQIVEYDAEDNRTTLDVTLITGRKHQIRRHLASIGFPVVGDYRYGEGGEPLALRAVSLAFRCPLNGREKFFSIE
jgi:tRNA pseudouridine32 synthase/23S rRNA pseudouridine746 synthase